MCEVTRTPHIHAEVIKAWADGAEIEYFNTTHKRWLKASTPTWEDNLKFRVKRVPKPDIIGYDFVRTPKANRLFPTLFEVFRSSVPDGTIAYVRVVYDGETGAMKSIEPADLSELS